MSFQPVAPLSGIAGWQFVQRTQQAQMQAFSQGAALQREVNYFKENIGSVTTVDELVGDYTLFKVALGAFGLEDKIADKFFFKKLLSEGSENDEAFALRLTDTRFREMAEAFGFGNSGGARVAQSGFAQSITGAYEVRQFEKAIGDADSTMRLALNLEREISTYADSQFPDSVAWFEMMANPPLREVFETAFGFPNTFATLDIDRQRELFQKSNERIFGTSSMAAFQDPANVEKLLQTFFAQAQIKDGPGALTPGMSALTLMQNAVNAAINFNRIR